MNGAFRDRVEAGLLLAPKLREFAAREDVIVLSLPRGGVPVGFEVARKLQVPLDVIVVRKLGVPGEEELGMGAIASGGVELRNNMIIAARNILPAELAAVIRRERTELERRERLYRGSRPEPNLQGKIVILVDDGIGTGSTMHAAVQAVKVKRPRAVIVAAPVAAPEAVDALRKEATAVVTVITTNRLSATGDYYRDFRQVPDREVQALLATRDARDDERTTTAA